MSSVQAHLGRLRAMRERTGANTKELMRNVDFQRHATLLVASHLDELAGRFGTEEPGDAVGDGLPAEWFTPTNGAQL